MKLIGLLLLTACFTCIAAVHNVQELIALGYQCGGTKEDVKWALLYELLDTRTSKCMYACMAKYYGVMNQQGVYSKKHAIKYVKTNWQEFDSYAYAAAEHCDQEMEKYSPEYDECEYGYQMVKCMRDYAKEKSYVSYAERARRLEINIQNGMDQYETEPEQYI